MKTKTVEQSFLTSKYFNFLKLKEIKIYTTSDFNYGNFIFYVNKKPKYCYNCFDKNGNEKLELKEVKDIFVFVSKLITKLTGDKIDKPNLSNTIFDKMIEEKKEILFLEEILDLSEPSSSKSN